MDVIYGLIPGMLILGLVGVAVFFWAARSGQFEDLEGEANRILMDDDLTEHHQNASVDEEKLTESDQPPEEEKRS
ncbi:cbb3-type cytochrome oxidase assembly protein CcoS [Sedimenticola selenatireducens]|uniref:Cbb3-type cytochrome oxidase assembly protein CcoS n=1 Tax=Sedimenticola selenatireducens TaxID=191960 RepID=A0A557SJS7_9GAMM|nr:cbb3-type cytochrome oxidase assembly protein CcoS [Sedimenticola selenatireducens]TVO77688.1 cbb3-type cytochrome oxidase assembly protein CcoS [Sedimenticola selenatireducens]TVT64994.1 MAG: cbb3-type cytochrome oxidase assembly protein CcoS [Sedimenticola selenatireducens]